MKLDLEKLKALCEDATPSLSVVQCWVSQEKADRQKDALLLKELPSLIAYCEKLETVAEKAKRLHFLMGDGDNGPALTYAEAWHELDEAFKKLEGS